jgi:5-methylcytosine-specific restriction endonuclease McrA
MDSDCKGGIATYCKFFLSGFQRSGAWPTVRKKHLAAFPACEVCASKENVQVHHLKSVSKNPELELCENNLFTLCAGQSCNCHFVFGHAFDWKRTNSDCVADSKNFRRKIEND